MDFNFNHSAFLPINHAPRHPHHPLPPPQGLALPPNLFPVQVRDISQERDIKKSKKKISRRPAKRQIKSPTPTGVNTEPEANDDEQLSIPVPVRKGRTQTCQPCRDRHLKCDGGTPCFRCRNDRSECTYQASKRGLRNKKKRRDDIDDTSIAVEPSESSGVASPQEQPVPPRSYPLLQPPTFTPYPPPFSFPILPSQLAPVTYAVPPSAVPTTFSMRDVDRAIPSNTRKGSGPSRNLSLSSSLASTHTPLQERVFKTEPRTPPAPSPLISERSTLPKTSIRKETMGHLHQLYYTNFHAAHPFLVPEAYFFAADIKIMPKVLLVAMDCAGSQYLTDGSVEKHMDNLKTLTDDPKTKQDVFLVQGLLLLAIVQHTQNQPDIATETLTRAVSLALQLEMNRKQFVLRYANQPILQESFRRTWWELYVVDAIMAAVRQKAFFALDRVPANVDLPWEEQAYAAQKPCKNATLEDMDAADPFDDEPEVFSSYAYRISIVKILGDLLRLNGTEKGVSASAINGVDIRLNNWRNYLPVSKQSPVRDDTSLDEMMFQAHLICNAALIFLHRQRSELVKTDVSDVTTCTPSREKETPSSRPSEHGLKSVEAANRLAELTRMSLDPAKHTPFLTCMVTLSAVVHLSAYVLSGDPIQREVFREHVKFNVGILKETGHYWGISNAVLMRIKMSAKEVMSFAAKISDVNNTNPALTSPSEADRSERSSSSNRSGMNSQGTPGSNKRGSGSGPGRSRNYAGSDSNASMETRTSSLGTDRWLETLPETVFAGVPDMDLDQ